MGDYLEEINTALQMRTEGVYYESLKDVQEDLEAHADKYREKALKYSFFATSLVGSGFFGQSRSEILDPVSEELGNAASSDELARIGLFGALGFSAAPAYLAHKNKKKYERATQTVQNLESEDFDDSSTEFAYEIIDQL